MILWPLPFLCLFFSLGIDDTLAPFLFSVFSFPLIYLCSLLGAPSFKINGAFLMICSDFSRGALIVVNYIKTHMNALMCNQTKNDHKQ